ncbi:MAG: DUF6482 family protein [Pseudomonadales bacterium]
MTLAELTELCTSGIPVNVEIHALTPMLYVIYRVEGEHRTPLRGARDSLKFPSRSAAQDALRRTGLAEATFIHNSAYGEMIGIDGAANPTEFRERISLRDD